MASSKDAVAHSHGECPLGSGSVDAYPLEGEAEAGSQSGYEIERLACQAGLGGGTDPQ